MKKLLLIFATILTIASAQAQTRYQLQANDIVTISRVNGTTRTYLTVNENYGLVVHNEPNDNSLWVIHTCSYASNKNQYTLQHYKTGRYLKIDGSESGNWWNSTYTITPSLITNGNPTTLYQDQPQKGENGVYEEGELYFSYDNKKFELSVNNSNAWVFQQNGNQALQVEKWERQTGTDFASYFSPETYDFNLVTSADKDINNENIDDKAVEAAVLMMFTLPGAVNVYYGDEVAIDGKTDAVEFARYPMDWEWQNKENARERFAYYQKLCKLKTTNEALTDGGFQILCADKQVLAYARFSDKQMLVTICSMDNEQTKVMLPIGDYGFGGEQVTEILGKDVTLEMTDGILVVHVPARESLLLALCK